MKTFLVLGVFFIANLTTLYAERPDNELPMYGGQYVPVVEPDKKNSKSAAKLGWQYYYNGDLDTAIKRFNQAWMFDRGNLDAFWGFGLILGRRADRENTVINLKESIKYLEIALQKSDSNPRIMVDLALSETQLANYLKENKVSSFKKHFDTARELYIKAGKLDKNYPLLYFNWSLLDYYEGNFRLAKSKLEKSKELGFNPDPNYERDLIDKIKSSE
ncbi:MAG: hypothetical protein P9M03_09990 [Candidatus Theseobacter exili]|nr:hypothetical protein [Candidatus Theseobacter exili]